MMQQRMHNSADDIGRDVWGTAAGGGGGGGGGEEEFDEGFKGTTILRSKWEKYRSVKRVIKKRSLDTQNSSDALHL